MAEKKKAKAKSKAPAKKKPAPKTATPKPPKAAEVVLQPPAPDSFKRALRTGLGTPGERPFTGLAWFDDNLYLATSARAPEGVARIHKRLPSGDWEAVYESPPQPLGDGTKMSRDYAITCLTVLKGPGDKAPCLYAGAASILGGHILRSEDGETYERVSPPGLNDDTQLSVTELTLFDGRMFAVTRGTITDQAHEPRWSPAPLVHVGIPQEDGDPIWEAACLPGFGDLANLEIATLTVAHGYLYASTINPSGGFELWRTKAEGAAPFTWDRVIQRGAWRFALNMEITAAAEFDGALFIGTGLPGHGHDATHDVGPGAAELIRVSEDGSWKLLAGEMRFSPDGLIVPESAMGAGLHNDFNAAISALVVHNGSLYLATRNWEPSYIVGIPVAEGETPPTLDGGAELWITKDGVQWDRIEGGALNEPAAIGIGHISGSKSGLALTLDLSGRAIARRTGLWTGFGLVDVPPDDETDVILAGVGPLEKPAPLSLDLDDGPTKKSAEK